MSVIECRSPVEIAEELLLEAAKQVFNVSRQDAVRLSIQMREVGEAFRKQAEDLMLAWEGTSEQCDRAHRIALHKRMAVVDRW